MLKSKIKNWDKPDKKTELLTAILNGTSSRIMVIDNDFRVVFLNKAVLNYLASLEGKIQVQLPNFRLETLLGTNIDDFHADPAYQRKMIPTLKTAFLTSISISGQVFNLRAFPLYNDEGERIGTAAEWSDPEQMDNASQMTAISRTQAIIEFDLNGFILKANERYLKMMGYHFSELEGKHHSIFVDKKGGDDADFQELWASLCRGESISGRYQRLDSRGNRVWLQASYNSIMDLRNRPIKIVQYSTEITPQVELVKTVQGLITEMTTAVYKAREESAAAASAAVQTLDNVSAAAAGAAEMDDSVREISQSMLKSSEAVTGVTGRAAGAAASTKKLATTARNMTGIVGLIQNIAGKINLLALNVTIEAARAGEAGKGFAVVASEVKGLARQAADATKLINDEIETIQFMATEVATAVSEMNTEMTNIQNYVTTSATAVEQQRATSQIMSANMSSAANMVQKISVNVAQINEVIQTVNEAAAKTEKASHSIA